MLAVDGHKIEFDLNAAVAHVVDVGIIGRIAQRGRRGERQQHVGRAAKEILDAAGDRTPVKAEFQTGIEVGVGLPGDILEAFVSEDRRNLAVRVLDRIGVRITEIADVVVTLRTDRSLELEVVEPFVRPGHEVLARDDPRAAHRPEVTPAMFGVETRRSVAAERRREEILVGVIVHHAREVAFVVVLQTRGPGVLHVDDGAGQFVVLAREHVALGCAEQVKGLVVVLVADHGVHVVVADLLRIVENLLRVVFILAGVLLREKALFAGKLAEIREV